MVEIKTKKERRSVLFNHRGLSPKHNRMGWLPFPAVSIIPHTISKSTLSANFFCGTIPSYIICFFFVFYHSTVKMSLHFILSNSSKIAIYGFNYYVPHFAMFFDCTVPDIRIHSKNRVIFCK